MDYYEGAHWLGASGWAPFSVFWRQPPLGEHSIVAVATGYLGVTNVSDPVQFSVGPPNDNFAAATILHGAALSVVGSSKGATLEAGEPGWNFGSPSVWYSWRAPTNGWVQLAMPDWAYGTYFGAYTGTCVSNLTKIADNQAFFPWGGGWYSGFGFTVQAGTNYRIVVAGDGGPLDKFTLGLNFYPHPANDDFEQRAVIPGTGGTVNGNNFTATFEPGEPGGDSYASLHSVWWTWTAPTNGKVKIQPSCPYNYLLGIYRGSVLTNLTPVAQALDSGEMLDVTAGTTWQISVDGYGGQSGVIQLVTTFYPHPANDNLNHAKLISGAATSFSGDNIAATYEPGEPVHAGVGNAGSVWWKWVAPFTGYVRLTPATNAADLVLAVYTGSVVSNLTQQAAVINGTAGFSAVAGSIYYFAIDGANNWQGLFKIKLSESPLLLTRPIPGASYYVGNSIILSATNTQVGWNLSFGRDDRPVDFFAGSAHLGTEPAYEPIFTWTNASLGYYTLTATAVYGGLSQTSQPVNIRVRPLNDDFINAFQIVGLNVTTNGINLGAGTERGEPTGGDSSADASVWYVWTAPVSGTAVVSIQENSFGDHSYGVYVGGSVSNLTSLGESIYDFYPISFVAHAGSTYYIEVSGHSDNLPGGTGPFGLSLNQTQAPPNDDFANAFTLSGTSLSVTGSNVGATSEPGEPDVGMDNSVWWTWTAPGRGLLTLDFNGTDFDPLVTLYTGSVESNLTSYGTHYTDFAAKFNVESNQTYHIAVEGRWYPAIEGNILMGLLFQPAPPNDNFASRLPLTGLVASATGSNTTATAEAGEPNSNGYTIWWTWTSPATGPVCLSTSGSSFAPWLAVYTGTAVTNLVLVTNGLSQLTITAIAGTVYQISVDANGGGQVGQVKLTLAAGYPANDNFINRFSLHGTSVSVIEANAGATEEPLEPVHGGYQGSNSIWFTWTPSAPGTLNITVTGDGFSPTWSVYTGSALNALFLVTDSYDWMWGVHSGTAIPVTPGVPVQIAVDGSSQLTGGPTGIARLNLSFAGLPANDNFAHAIPIAGPAATVTGTTQGATKEPGEPEHAGYSGGHSIWWSFTAPASGWVKLDTVGSSLTTLVGVYTGNVVSNLTEVASGNATYAPVQFYCNAGITYQIALDHWYPDMSGAVVLNLLFSTLEITTPANDTVFYGTAPIAVAAQASIWDGPFTELDFLVDGAVIGSATNPPYAFVWTNPPLGDHTLQVQLVNSNIVTRLSPGCAVHLRPANDDFADRTVVTGSNVVLHAQGPDATLEPGEPAHGYYSWESVWWSWTAPAAGQVTLSKPDGYAYAIIAVYAGSALTNLVLVTNTPESGNGTLYSMIDFDTQAGTEYQIAVAGSFFYATDLPVTLSFTPDPAGSSTVRGATVIAGTPALGLPVRLSPTRLALTLSGMPGTNYTVLSSPDLTSPVTNWFILLTTNLSGSSITIQDNDATNHQRFYRLKIDP